MARTVLVWLLFFCFGLVVCTCAEDTGHIQVICEPGVAIALDGVDKGVTNAEHEGLFIANVPAGKHTVKVSKVGTEQREIAAVVIVGRVAVIRIVTKDTPPKPTDGSEESVLILEGDRGSLEVWSIPVNCRVVCLSAGLSHHKLRERWAAEFVPVGRHELTLTHGDKVLKTAIEIESNLQTLVTANFLTMEITTVVGAPGANGFKPRYKFRNVYRMNRVNSQGGSNQTEAAVVSGLKWLADNQEPDGYWDTAKWGGHRPYDPGVTGLALLAFVGAGNTETAGTHSNTVARAVKWLSQNQDKHGNFAPGQTMYNHAIPLVALLELAGMTPSPELKTIAEKGLQYMLAVQNPGKAWRYWPKDGDNDTSVTHWCARALSAAESAGIPVPVSSTAGVKAFVDSMTNADSGQVGYARGSFIVESEQPFQGHSMTACGMHIRLDLGVPITDPLMVMGALILMENLPEWNQPGINAPFFYYWEAASSVVFQVGGKDWDKWNGKMSAMLVQHQLTASGELMGSWDPESQHYFGQMGGRVVSTAFGVLTLETYYRYARPDEK